MEARKKWEDHHSKVEREDAEILQPHTKRNLQGKILMRQLMIESECQTGKGELGKTLEECHQPPHTEGLASNIPRHQVFHRLTDLIK